MTLPAYYTNLRLDTRELWPATSKKVLEVGCSSGLLASVLSCEEYWGVEPSSDAASVAASNISSTIINATFLDALPQLPRKYFDLVICHDSIEHMPDHEQFLRLLPSVCSSNCELILTVPNIRHVSVLYGLIINADFPYSSHGIMDSTHLRWFTEKSLKRALLRQGYSIIEFRRMQRTFFTPNPIKKYLGLFASIFLGGDSLYAYFAVKARLPLHVQEPL